MALVVGVLIISPSALRLLVAEAGDKSTWRFGIASAKSHDSTVEKIHERGSWWKQGCGRIFQGDIYNCCFLGLSSHFPASPVSLPICFPNLQAIQKGHQPGVFPAKQCKPFRRAKVRS